MGKLAQRDEARAVGGARGSPRAWPESTPSHQAQPPACYACVAAAFGSPARPPSLRMRVLPLRQSGAPGATAPCRRRVGLASRPGP